MSTPDVLHPCAICGRLTRSPYPYCDTRWISTSRYLTDKARGNLVARAIKCRTEYRRRYHTRLKAEVRSRNAELGKCECGRRLHIEDGKVFAKCSVCLGRDRKRKDDSRKKHNAADAARRSAKRIADAAADRAARNAQIQEQRIAAGLPYSNATAPRLPKDAVPELEVDT